MLDKIIKYAAILLVVFATSCTPRVWVSRNSVAQISSFFIDKENNRIVLMGENIKGFHYINDNYAIPDKTGNLTRIFEIGQKSKNPVISIPAGAFARGKIFSGRLWIAFQKSDNITDEEKEFLEKINMLPEKNNIGNKSFGYWISLTALKSTRYLSTEEKPLNFCKDQTSQTNCIKITKFSNPNQIHISELNTPSETAIKVAKTPFTVIADIIMIPYYFYSLMASGMHQEDYPYKCQGDFCNPQTLQKKIENNSK